MAATAEKVEKRKRDAAKKEFHEAQRRKAAGKRLHTPISMPAYALAHFYAAQRRQAAGNHQAITHRTRAR